MKLKLSAFDYPSVRNLGGGENVKVVISGRVGLRFVSSGEDFAEIEIDSADIEKDSIREHPGEIMKKMVELQGMVNTPTV